MPGQEEGKITRFCRWLPASTHAISHVSLLGTSLQRTYNHTMVTLDQERKEELFHEVFDEYGDNPIPE